MTPPLPQSRRPAPPRSEPSGAEPGHVRPIRARAIVLGLVLIPPLCWWSIRTEIISGGSEMIEASLLVIVVFTLLVLVAVNSVVRRRFPRAALSRAELLFIYILHTSSVGVAGLGQIQFLNQALGGAFYYATPENGWASFHQYIPRWWVPDRASLTQYYLGDSTFFTPDHVRGWAVPIVVWTAFLMTMMVSFLCLNTVFRKHWIEQERLTFPLVALPIALSSADAPDSHVRRRSFWLAFAGACIYRSVSGLHRLFPDFPDWGNLMFKGQLIDLASHLTSPPWNAVDYLVVSFHPMIVGITYLLPLDVSFSSWFFYLVVQFEKVISAAFGDYTAGANASAALSPHIGDQGAGAYLGIALLSLWGARRHIGAVVSKAFRNAPTVHDDTEPLSYRSAVFGFLASFAALVLFVALGGLPWYLAALFFLAYFLMITTVTRLRAVAGLMLSYGPDTNPHEMLVEIPGSWNWNARSLTPLAYLAWFDSDYRTVAMPQQMESFKIQDTVPGIPGRQLTRWILIAALTAILASFVSVLAIYYHYGALTPRGDNGWRAWNGQAPFWQLKGWLDHPLGPDYDRLRWIGIGTAIVLVLSAAHSSIVEWPFHPAGFAIANSGWAMPWVWFPTLLGWLAKWLILRYGGLALYRRALPFFLGLILGDIVNAVLWSMVGVALNVQTYMFFPG